MSRQLKAEGLGRLWRLEEADHPPQRYEHSYAYSRLAYAEVQPAEGAECATRFLHRALRWFASVGVHCERLLSDNATRYGSRPFISSHSVPAAPFGSHKRSKTP